MEEDVSIKEQNIIKLNILTVCEIATVKDYS